MLILLDQDGVLADFERGFHEAWDTRMGNLHPALPLEQRRAFYVRDDYPDTYRNEVEAVYHAQGFYRDLPVISGAIEAIQALLEFGHDVRICTSPLNQYRFCLPEKYEWVERNLGPDFVHRMIVTKDKTVILGDVLVDDKPSVTGTRTPAWQHVIFDQPYNRQADGPRMTWENWNAVLGTVRTFDGKH
ncbi:5'-3'-deoxyribonucleotidase [Parasulfuritortus cantonensis]|uniref:5'-3'-deoxyribonucleotidase n=1 Tax=Parasulfuritortus cantonensis TaxID=2528202 RepID=A0A4R1BCX2_9PROT|nr:5'-3'-deoxyribonucleotidase [Parasulfuritortus cantonensis]TCJ14925.1 5'-3'-deoxyribonucleotidase [Parasulfuritortus cantonensis]